MKDQESRDWGRYQCDDFVQDERCDIGIFPEEKAKQPERFFTRTRIFDDLLQENVAFVNHLRHGGRNDTDRIGFVRVIRIGQEFRFRLEPKTTDEGENKGETTIYVSRSTVGGDVETTDQGRQNDE